MPTTAEPDDSADDAADDSSERDGTGDAPTAGSPEEPIEEPPVALIDEARRALEAVLMVVDEPADPSLLAQLVELPTETVEQLLGELSESYEAEGRGFQLVRVAGGWRFQSHEACAPWVERYVLSGQSSRLSAAALETLAIVAYRQPIARADIEAVRGVNVDGVMQTLTEKGVIRITGRAEVPGRPLLYGTTEYFLEHFSLRSLDELPNCAELRRVDLPKASADADQQTLPLESAVAPTGENGADLPAETEAQLEPAS